MIPKAREGEHAVRYGQFMYLWMTTGTHWEMRWILTAMIANVMMIIMMVRAILNV